MVNTEKTVAVVQMDKDRNWTHIIAIEKTNKTERKYWKTNEEQSELDNKRQNGVSWNWLRSGRKTFEKITEEGDACVIIMSIDHVLQKSCKYF